MVRKISLGTILIWAGAWVLFDWALVSFLPSLFSRTFSEMLYADFMALWFALGLWFFGERP